MPYWVYENWTHDRARMHAGSCNRCNDGSGANAAGSGRNGRWLGPFDGRAEAERVMVGLGRSDTGVCAFCGAGDSNRP